MNADQFIDELTAVFEKQPKPQQLVIYRDKLRRFSPEQLVEVLNRVLEEAKYFPKVSEIYKAARELGYLALDLTVTRHRWQASPCSMCHGEGRVATIWACHVEDRPGGRVEVQTLARALPYSESLLQPIGAKEFRSIFRCKCMAGDAATIPRAWPKWGPSTNPVREVWL